MNKIGKKYQSLVRFIGFCFIGFGFWFMILITYTIIRLMISFFLSPKVVDTGMALVLPGMTLPGFGRLFFWHWIIAIFVLAIVHEGAHGIMARAYNIRIKSSGFALFSILVPLLPAAFVEPDEKQLKKQPAHVQYSVYAAGPMVNIIIAFLLLFALPWVNPLNVTEQNLAPFEDYFSDANGFSINTIPNYAAYNASIPNGAIVQSLNNEKVIDFMDFAKKMQSVKSGDEVILGIYHEDKSSDYSLITTENPNIPGKGYVGVVGLSNERSIKKDREFGANIYYWFKGFLMWLYLFNLAVGLFNFLPLGIVDGGRMLQIMLKTVFKNKKKAQEYWVFISFFLLVLLLIGIVAHYLKGWGLF